MTGSDPQRLLSNRNATLTRRNFLLGGGSLAAGLALYSGEIARHEVSTTTHTIRIRNLPSAFLNHRIVQISDIHFDEFTEPFFLRRIVEHVNTLHADLLLLTGDFVSLGPLPIEYARRFLLHCATILAGLTCPIRFACMGNHDTAVGIDHVMSALAAVRIPTLHNNYTSLERNGQHLILAGVADPATGQPNLHLTLPQQPTAPVILLCHGPDFADNVVAHPRGHVVDFMLSGHSHGGQVRIPLLGPMALPPWGQKYVEGHFQIQHLQLYVNRGIGTVGLPLRLNCPPEISVFTLQAA